MSLFERTSFLRSEWITTELCTSPSSVVTRSYLHYWSTRDLQWTFSPSTHWGNWYTYKWGERKPYESKGFRRIAERLDWGNLSRLASRTGSVPDVISSDGYFFLLQPTTREAMDTRGRGSFFHSTPIHEVWVGLPGNSDSWRTEWSSLFRTHSSFHIGIKWDHPPCGWDHTNSENGEEWMVLQHAVAT